MLNSPEKIRDFAARFFPLLALGVTLSGCINSSSPILSDAKPLLGERGVIHAIVLSGGDARDPGLVSFQWSGSRYVLSSKSIGISDFTAHPYEGRDFIIQGTARRPPHHIAYGLARKIADDVYLLLPINETDADDATREKFCTKTQDSPCEIATPEQLFVFARARADMPPDSDALAVVAPRAESSKRR